MRTVIHFAKDVNYPSGSFADPRQQSQATLQLTAGQAYAFELIYALHGLGKSHVEVRAPKFVLTRNEIKAFNEHHSIVLHHSIHLYVTPQVAWRRESNVNAQEPFMLIGGTWEAILFRHTLFQSANPTLFFF
jgi:hypothetical protein